MTPNIRLFDALVIGYVDVHVYGMAVCFWYNCEINYEICHNECCSVFLPQTCFVFLSNFHALLA